MTSLSKHSGLHTLLDFKLFLTIWYMRSLTPLRRLMEIIRKMLDMKSGKSLTALQFDLRCVVCQACSIVSMTYSALESLSVPFSGRCSVHLSDSCVRRIHSNAFCSSRDGHESGVLRKKCDLCACVCSEKLEELSACALRGDGRPPPSPRPTRPGIVYLWTRPEANPRSMYTLPECPP